jgi:hypothetical protein
MEGVLSREEQIAPLFLCASAPLRVLRASALGRDGSEEKTGLERGGAEDAEVRGGEC